MVQKNKSCITHTRGHSLATTQTYELEHPSYIVYRYYMSYRFKPLKIHLFQYVLLLINGRISSDKYVAFHIYFISHFGGLFKRSYISKCGHGF